MYITRYIGITIFIGKKTGKMGEQVKYIGYLNW